MTSHVQHSCFPCYCYFIISQWFDADAPELIAFPMEYSDITNDFQHLMLLRCFRIDRVYRAVTDYVAKIMGEKYVMPPIISFESIFEQSTPLSPIVFILSPGSDPAADLMKLAERSGFGSSKLKYLSLGQGQEKVIYVIILRKYVEVKSYVLNISVCRCSQMAGCNSCLIVSGNVSNCSYRLTVYPVTSSRLSSA